MPARSLVEQSCTYASSQRLLVKAICRLSCFGVLRPHVYVMHICAIEGVIRWRVKTLEWKTYIHQPLPNIVMRTIAVLGGLGRFLAWYMSHLVHVSRAVCQSCLRPTTVFKIHMSLRPDVHGNNCFLLPMVGAQYELGLALQLRAEEQEPLVLPGQFGACRPQRSAASEREASEGPEAFAGPFFVELLAHLCPVWRHAADSVFVLLVVSDIMNLFPSYSIETNAFVCWSKDKRE